MFVLLINIIILLCRPVCYSPSLSPSSSLSCYFCIHLVNHVVRIHPLLRLLIRCHRLLVIIILSIISVCLILRHLLLI